jgi:hypothetical protein
VTNNEQVNDVIVYPGTGMLVMAMEAVRLAANTNQRILGFLVKEAHFKSPIIIEKSSTEATETVTRLRPIQNAFEKESGWFEVTIHSYRNGTWSECFLAKIQAEYAASKTQKDAKMERHLELERAREKYQDSVTSCSYSIVPWAFYAHCQESGIAYGEAFQLLRNIIWDGKSRAVAQVKRGAETTSLVHPATLDAALQLSMVQLSRGLLNSVATAVPHQRHNTWISAEGWNESSTKALFIASEIIMAGRSGSKMTSVVLSDDGTPLCIIGTATMAPLSSTRGTGSSPRPQRLIHKVDWKPQLSLQSPDQLSKL